MKALLLSEIFPPKTGGSGRWFWEIYRRLPRESVVVAAGEDVRQEEFDASHDLRVERLPLTLDTWGVASFRAAKGYWRAVRAVRKLIRRDRPSVIHAGRCLPEGVMSMALKLLTGIPYVCYVHGEDVNTAWSSRELTFLVRRVLMRADYCIANSRNTAALLTSDWGLPESRVKVLHPGVDTSQFAPESRCAETRRTLGWHDRPVVMTVGRLQRRKGQDMLIRALPKLHEVIPDVLYCIIGDGDERNNLVQLANKCGVVDSVQFRGETTDEELAACYRQCDLFALPNREIDGDIEGFGMVLLEAQACGRPVLAGDSGGTIETMRPGETGRIVDCTNPHSLGDALIELLSDNRRLDEMGRLARHWVTEHFDWIALAGGARKVFNL